MKKEERKAQIDKVKKKIWDAVKGVPRKDIMTACNSISRYISEKSKAEKRIQELKDELKNLEEKRKRR